MPLSSAHLRRLADELDAEEAQEKRELEQAETDEQRSELRRELEETRAELAEIRAQMIEPEPEAEQEEPEAEQEEKPAKPKMRRGRKRGQVYQDEKGAVGYVYQGDDEDDLVSVDEDVA